MFTLLSFALIIHGTSFSSEKDSKNFFGVPEGAPFKLISEAYGEKLEKAFSPEEREIIDEAYNKELQKRGFDEYGLTPLMYAIRKEKKKIKVEELLAEGASVNERDIRTFTPLHHAAIEGDTEIINILIQCKANLNAQTDDGQTPLHKAKDGKTVKHFLSLGALILKDNSCMTPLHRKIQSTNIDAAKELILSGKEDLDAISEFGSPLELAMSQDSFEIMKILIQAGANVNKYNQFGTPLRRAVLLRSRLTIVQYLLSQGADVNGCMVRGSTPLHLAVYLKNKELCELLCKAGADVTIKDEENRTPFDLFLEHWQ
ncbi:MAG: ankyrin repeat domain-containing protein [Candidatus Babeliales bacterium]